MNLPSFGRAFHIITPGNPQERGAQLSLMFAGGIMQKVLDNLKENGVVVDERKPDVIRVAPVPLYNTFEEVWHFATILDGAIEGVLKL